MDIIVVMFFLAVCIIIPRFYANRPWVWAIALWLICGAAREKIWRDTYLIAPIENLIKRILHT